jgi:hypothetical protein
MSPEERQSMVDIAEIVVSRYFGHYLEKVLPVQMKQFLQVHQSGCPWGKKLNRIMWMVAGASVVLGIGGTISAERILRVLTGP